MSSASSPEPANPRDHPYVCQCKGHSSGSRDLFHHRPEWFRAKGAQLPKNCPDCRAWNSAQVDEEWRCNRCGRITRITANWKISHHKHVGQYVRDTTCTACLDAPPPRPSVRAKPPARRSGRKSVAFARLPLGRSLQSYRVDTNPEHYGHTVHDRSGPHTRLEHLARHMRASVHYRLGKSPTALAANSVDVGDLLRSVQVAVGAQQAQRCREYRERRLDGRERIIRLTLTDSEAVESTILEPIDGVLGAVRVVTTYSWDSVEALRRKNFEIPSAGSTLPRWV